MSLASTVRSAVQRFVRFAVIGAALFFAIDGRADEIAKQWRGVTRVRGALTVEFHEWIHERTTTNDKREEAQVHFVLEVDSSHDSTGMIWRATEAAITGSIHGEANVIPYGRSTTEASFSGAPVSLDDFTLTLDPTTGVWQLVSPGILAEKYPVVSHFYGDDPNVVTEKSDAVQSVVFNGKVAVTPGLINGSYTYEGLIDHQPTRGFSKIGSLQLWPEFDDLEVEVTIDGYDTWRPLGSIDNPGKAGNSLVAHAVLKPKNGKVKKLPDVDRFRFRLMDTSREPGVCMNWPLNATDHDFDLKFADPSAAPNEVARKFYVQWGLQSGGDYDAASLPAGPLPTATFGQVSDNGQKLEYTQFPKDKEGRPFADALIECFDFGGKAELQVICLLKDGREIVGLMKGDGGVQDIVRIPKRKGFSWVAEAWRKEMEVEDLPDDDDSEKVEGQKNDGDGFTLYEEYRGFAVHGRHVGGDPKMKDFFILNLVGPDVLPGIHMFEAATKLRVIYRLLPSEMAQGSRLMNGNHRDAPHRVDQHGVWIKTYGAGQEDGHGAATSLTKGGLAGRPGITKSIGVPARNDSDSDFNQPFNLPPAAVANAFDRAVAHELAHSVGAIHHGVDDFPVRVRYLSGSDPRNPLSPLPGLLAVVNSSLIRVDIFYESPQERIIDRLSPLMEQQLEQLRAQVPDYANADEATRNRVADQLGTYNWYIGMPRGQCSGNDQCLMRYDFADLYPMTGAVNHYYLVTPGTENVGTILCRSAVGTGRNKAGRHDPQTRYFDANADLKCGNCFGSICPNDAIPPPTKAAGL